MPTNVPRRIELTDSFRRRFWKYAKPSASGHLVWVGTTNNKGYGMLAPDHGGGRGVGPLLAHRVSFEIHNGRPPDGFVLHHCDRPACVDPRCLFEGSQKDNITDAVRKGRTARGERVGTAILTQQEVLQIREVAPFLLRREIAEGYKVTRETVSDIVGRRSWAWLK